MELASAYGSILGFSDDHSSLVANFCHFITGYISPLFHLVFNDLFDTVICTRYDDSVYKSICNHIFELNKDWYVEDEHDETGNLMYQITSLEDVWIDEQCCRDISPELDNQRGS